MSKILFALIFLCMASPVYAENKISPEWLQNLKAAKNANQLAIVIGTEGSNADFSFHEKDDSGEWHEIISCGAYIGKKGFGQTREGDAITPRGVYTFTMAFGINDDPGCPMGYTKVDDSNYWVSDSDSKYYNQFVSTRDYDDFNKKDSEHIIDYTEAYKYCLNISYNENGTPGKGSAIFLHCQTKNKFTAGCVAIPENQMQEVLKHVKDGCIVIMDTDKNIGAY